MNFGYCLYNCRQPIHAKLAQPTRFHDPSSASRGLCPLNTQPFMFVRVCTLGRRGQHELCCICRLQLLYRMHHEGFTTVTQQSTIHNTEPSCTVHLSSQDAYGVKTRVYGSAFRVHSPHQTGKPAPSHLLPGRGASFVLQGS